MTTPSAEALRPYTTLQRLLSAAPGAEPEALVRLAVGESGDGDDLESHFVRLSLLLEECVARVSGEWGPPAFHGTVEDETFPAWSDALVLAAWWRGEVVALLALRHEDETDPLTLEAAAHTREELDGLQAWHPAPPELRPGSEDVS